MSKIDINDYIKTFYNFGADVHGDRLTAEKSTIESALKLQKSVKERIFYLADDRMHQSMEKAKLQSLIKESEK